MRRTIDMAGVARLARVQRPVVSLWRTRTSASAVPFPRPVTTDPLTFDAQEVAQWLEETGRGNNKHAAADVTLHTGAVDALAAHPADSSALLMLHHLQGEALGDTPFHHVVLELLDDSLGWLLDVKAAANAYRNAELRSCVDELAEAGFGALGVFDRLLDHAAHGPWAAEALSPRLSNAVVGVLAELARLGRYSFIPRGPGALMMAASCARDSPEAGFSWEALPGDLADAWSLAAWRYLAAAGGSLIQHDPSEKHPTVYIQQLVAAPDSHEFFERVEDAVLDLAPADVLVALGPDEWLTGEAGVSQRLEVLRPHEDSGPSLRYAARLPKGLATHAGRRRLALWVVGGQKSPWTLLADYGDSNLETSAGLLAADVAVAIDQEASVHTHAFHRSEVVDARKALKRRALVRPVAGGVSATGGERLATIWELDGAAASGEPAGQRLLTGFIMAARDGAPHVLTLEAASKKLLREIPGARIPSEHMGVPGAGHAVVLGEEEIRDPSRRGERGIDRLTLEAVAPRARLTQPGDVVYVASKRPRATVDWEGGHVVPFPAKVLRCRGTPAGGRRLVPDLVARDINEQASGDRKNWLLRTVEASQLRGLTRALNRVQQRRTAVERQLQVLELLENELSTGAADGVLTIDVSEST